MSGGLPSDRRYQTGGRGCCCGANHLLRIHRSAGGKPSLYRCAEYMVVLPVGRRQSATGLRQYRQPARPDRSIGGRGVAVRNSACTEMNMKRYVIIGGWLLMPLLVATAEAQPSGQK